jgi:RHS repeat-associated protein
MTYTSGTRTHTNDAAGRMVAAEGMTQTLAYTYTADGLRVAENADGEATTFVWDLASPLAQVLATSDGARYVHGLDLVAEGRSGAWAYPLGDALGSVRQWTDGDGYVTCAGGYTPFGTEMWTEGSTSSNWGFTGEWWDARVGMVYLRARWYEPGVGRFGQVDPWEGDYRQPQSLHPYVYASDSPVNRVDPSGLYGEAVHLDFTWRSAFELATVIRSSSVEPARLASIIAGTDQHMDEGRELLPIPGACFDCHFCPPSSSRLHVAQAIDSGNPYYFGASVHQLQDLYSHWDEGYTTFSGHALDTIAYRYRTYRQIDDFYRGSHQEFAFPFWVAVRSPFPPHARDSVVRDVLRRNPAMNVAALSDSDLIDVYLRHEVGADHKRMERRYLGFDTDRHFERSSRDSGMRQETRRYIRQFLNRIVGPCAADWREPGHAQIRTFLTR